MKKQWEFLDEGIIVLLSVSPISGRLFALDFKGSVNSWALDEVVSQQEINSTAKHLRSLEISPDEYRLCIVSLTESQFYKKVNGVFSRELFGQFAPHTCALKFTPDSNSIIFAPGSQILTNKNLLTTKDFDWEDVGDRCAGISIHPNNDLIAISACWSALSELQILRLSDVDYRKSLELQYDELTQPTFSSDGKWLAVGHWIPVVYAMEDVENQLQNDMMEEICDGEKKLASPHYQFDLDGRSLSEYKNSSTVDSKRMWTRQIFEMKRNVFIAGSPEGNLFVWNLEDGSLRSQVQAHKGKIFDIVLSLDGESLVSCGADGYLRVWDLE